MLELSVAIVTGIVIFIATYVFLTLHYPKREGKGMYVTWQ